MALYEYVGGNPILRLDPFGSTWVVVVIGGVVVIVWLSGCSKPAASARTDAECCAAAMAAGEDRGDGGGVICCDGRMVACHFRFPRKMTNPEARTIRLECTIAHERDHFDDVAACPEMVPYLRRAHFKDQTPEFRDRSECDAYLVELDCLVAKRPLCGGDAECLNQIDELTRWVREQAIKYCLRVN